jgi:ABC-type polysaccharide/polyol phosphate transport system ATPase subunit/SAM-dependent methyltransferase
VTPVIRADSVSKRFMLRHNASGELKVRFLGLLDGARRGSVEEFWALKGVTLRVERGDSVGLVGRNGSGKSTFLKLVAAIHRPTSGRLLVARAARITSMIELGVGFHPELTGRENVFLNCAIHGLSGPEIEAIYQSIVEFSGLAHFIDVPIKNYSSGMHMRLGFAIAANLDPDILLLDEIFAVGDADFQYRCIETVKRFLDEGKTLMFVSHSPAAIRSICSRVCVLDRGELVFDGDTEGGMSFYDRLLARAVASGDGGVNPTAGVVDDAPLDRAPHRVEAGGLWREAGQWQFDFLRRHGLEKHHRVLDVGCGSLNLAVLLIPFLNAGGYVGLERNRAMLEAGLRIELPRAGLNPAAGQFIYSETFDLSEVPAPFDFAIASSVFPFLSLNSVARCIVSVVRRLGPKGRFYITGWESDDATRFDPIPRAPGLITFSDREPYHYPLEVLSTICERVGARIERVDDTTHPRGESIYVISK